MEKVRCLSRRFERKSLPTIYKDKSKTQQHFKKSTLLYKGLIKKARLCGSVSVKGIVPMNKSKPMFGDLSVVSGMDFLDMKRIISKYNTAFMDMPASVRARFDNDVSKMLDFVKDPANRRIASDLGLLAKLDPVYEEVVVPADGDKPEVREKRLQGYKDPLNGKVMTVEQYGNLNRESVKTL